MVNSFISKLNIALSEKLPGKDVQYKMAPTGRLPLFPKKEVIQGSVLILLYPREKIHVVLIKRSDYDGPHGGQVSFPGGKSEPSDVDVIHTALREANEEVGINPGDITILGTLTPLYIPPSNFMVSPVVAYSAKIPDFQINTREVNYVFTPSIDDFLKPDTLKYKTLEIFKENISVPYFDVNNEEVWGATAMIMNEFLEIVKRIF
jgi:8-oxo-dGTP pyrophosphatase MutT (NUDIX family)